MGVWSLGSRPDHRLTDPFLDADPHRARHPLLDRVTMPEAYTTEAWASP